MNEQATNLVKGPKEKLTAGLLAIFLGSFGAHKFYLGYKKPAIIMLVLSLVTCGLAASVTGVIGLIEGIMYISKSDEEFQETYVTNERHWF
jgi:Predicted membrane protein